MEHLEDSAISPQHHQDVAGSAKIAHRVFGDLLEQFSRFLFESNQSRTPGKLLTQTADERCGVRLSSVSDESDQRRKHARNSLLPPPPRIGDSITPHHVARRVPATKSRILHTARS